MTEIIIKILTSNDAFRPEPETEIVRILNKVTQDILTSGLATEKAITDLNGNKVGSITIKC